MLSGPSVQSSPLPPFSKRGWGRACIPWWPRPGLSSTLSSFPTVGPTERYSRCMLVEKGAGSWPSPWSLLHSRGSPLPQKKFSAPNPSLRLHPFLFDQGSEKISGACSNLHPISGIGVGLFISVFFSFSSKGRETGGRGVCRPEGEKIARVA